ncbi:prepilin peptidase [Photobacterium sp. ZSDE20]|uniref:Prepilin peptidase n=1 Tax=Photobacterium pectinilyticum TaxID=2906793 RepID=A0ABT1N2V1_9GAMM|nr:prepilin peptidase [Photobacterium sp. ZSDE20]MCQ1058862.1 prepilin peptidase [Photobacterium sp. ZSDE20]MDD1823848.1 prepilin peptidase [Photobacterium sp. ZSDE20]
MSMPIILIVYYAALYDMKHCKIPNEIILILISLGFIQILFGIVETNSNALVITTNALIGLFVALSISILLYHFGLFGAGDAKLLASLGVFIGPYNAVILIATSIAFSGLLALLRLSCYGELRPMLTRWYDSVKSHHYFKPQKNTIAHSAVPMGGAILLATVYCHFYLF